MMRLIIISDIRLYADGLAEILGNIGRVNTVAVADSVKTGVNQIQKHKPDVVLLDMAIQDSCQAVKQIAATCSASRIVVLSVPEDAMHIHTCAEAGIVGYVAREDSVEDLLKAIENAMAGEIHCPSHLARCLFRQVKALAKRETVEATLDKNQLDIEPSVEQLTRREQQIAGLLSQGLSNKQIARDLSIELSTVKNHVHNILVKVGAHSRTQAVAFLKNDASASVSRTMDLEVHC